MAIKDIKIGQTTEQIVNNIVDNFEALDEGKEPAITKQTAFNKAFSVDYPLANNSVPSAGTADTVSRGDHVHPTDLTRLSVQPDGTNYLIVTGNGTAVINTKYLPDSILGQLEYKGTFNATDMQPLVAEHGWYYICIYDGLQNPDGTSQASGYRVGDWAVYNAKTKSWDKVDNTDAVTMVNGRIGAIDTYRGMHSTLDAYHKGDMVSDANGRIYICKSDVIANKQLGDKTYWLPTGSIMGVTFNGEDVVDANGIANIVLNLDEVAGTIVPATTVEYPINGVNYYGILIANTDTEFEVFVDSKKVVTQSFIVGNNIFIACAQSAGVTVEVRKLKGGAVSSAKYHHHINLYYASENPQFNISFDVYNSRSSEITSISSLQTYAQGIYSASGIYSPDGSGQSNVTRVTVAASQVNVRYWGSGIAELTRVISTATVIDTVTEL